MFWSLAKKILFQLDPELAHHLGAIWIQWKGFFYRPKDPQVTSKRKVFFELGGVPVYHPLGVAAGFDKDAKLVLGLSQLGFGFVEIGSVTPLPQKGNSRPRLFRLPEAEALINRMGFNSEGADRVAARLEYLRAIRRPNFPIGINLGKNKDTPLERAADDYVIGVQRLYPFSDYMVVNLSSPNTPGLTSLQEGNGLADILVRVRATRDDMAKRTAAKAKPLLLKISPDLMPEARVKAIHIAMEAGFQGIIASNTSRRRNFKGLEGLEHLDEDGGLSGLPLREEALGAVKEIRALLGPKPILISVGGLGEGDDLKARLDAGANLVQCYTSFVYQGPGYPKRLLRAVL